MEWSSPLWSQCTSPSCTLRVRGSSLGVHHRRRRPVLRDRFPRRHSRPGQDGHRPQERHPTAGRDPFHFHPRRRGLVPFHLPVRFLSSRRCAAYVAPVPDILDQRWPRQGVDGRRHNSQHLHNSLHDFAIPGGPSEAHWVNKGIDGKEYVLRIVPEHGSRRFPPSSASPLPAALSYRSPGPSHLRPSSDSWPGAAHPLSV